jgi:hypothetical protein
MRALLLSAVLLLLLAAPAGAAPELVKLGDFKSPVYIASPPRGSQVFVVEREGMIKTITGDTFLDIRGKVAFTHERGLLSMAFAPDYVTSGRFYILYTAADNPTGEIRIVEYRRSANDPNAADPGSARTIFHIPHQSPEHNGGQIQIGPDGMLWAGLGDNQSNKNAQDVTVPYGKIVRLDPATGGPAPGNPHGYVWAYGLRNPWRFSFDRLTGDIAIADVGLSTWEEIDWGAAPNRARNVNFGWPESENDPGFGQAPILQHPHPDFGAIIGGYVVRDPGLPSLNGRYIYTDLGNGNLWSAIPRTGADDRQTGMSLQVPTTFGEDACGHIYVASLHGDVYRIQDGPVSTCPAATDFVAPRLRVSLRGVRHAARKGRILVKVRCSEACRVTVGTRLRDARWLPSQHRRLAARQRVRLSLHLGHAAAARLHKQLEEHSSVPVRVTVRAVDEAGNSRRVQRTGRVIG